MNKRNTAFVFDDWFQTTKALSLPLAFQTPTFANNFSTKEPSWLHVIAVADFNNDNLDDVVLSLSDSKREPYFLMSQGDGTFRLASSVGGDAQRQFIRNGTTSDLNKDGWLDFVGFESTHAMANQQDLILINNAGKGFTVAKGTLTPTEGHHGGAVGDFNGDGLLDVFGIREFGYPQYGGTDLRVPLIQGSDGSWQLSTHALPVWLEAYGLAAATMADLNGDGAEDLVLGVSIMAKDQSGIPLSYERIIQTPTVIIAYATPGQPLSNWKFEAVGRHWVDAQTYAEFVTRFGQPGSNATAGANSLAVMDINQDGKLDIVAGSYLTEGFIHRTGGFQAFINIGAGFADQTDVWFPDQLANRDFDTGFNFLYSLEDFNADGHMDFLVTTMNGVSWPENAKYGTYHSLFMGQGDAYVPVRAENMRVFDNTVIGAYLISNAIAGDFNGDGVPDLISLRNESDFDWSPNATPTKTGYVVISHLNKALENDPRTVSTLVGTAGDDFLQSTDSMPMLRGLSGNDVLQGRAGKVDMAVYHGSRRDFVVSSDGKMHRVTDRQGNEGTDLLRDIERISFSDVHLALDLDAHSGTVAKILGAVFGQSAVDNKAYVGIGLSLLDGGMSYESLVALALGVQLGQASTSAQVVDLLYSNVVGNIPDPETREYYTGLLDSGAHTMASLGVLAANTDINRANIDLVGLAKTGLAYLPFEG
jgi:hypothetical protein